MLRCAHVSEGGCGLQEKNTGDKEIAFMRMSEIVGGFAGINVNL